MLLCASSVWADSYEEKALKLEQQERWTEARRAWQLELIQSPKNFDARYNLGKLLEKSGHTADAKRLYEKNMMMGRHLASAVALTQLYMRKDQYLAASDVLKQATKNFRHEAVPWYLLAEIAIQHKQVKQARHYFLSSLKADPLNGFAHLRYAHFLSTQKQHSQAIRHAEKSLRLQKTCAPCWKIYGDILLAAQHQQDALQAYQRSLAILPAQDTRRQLIYVLRQLGQQQRAERMQQGLKAWEKNMPSQ